MSVTGLTDYDGFGVLASLLERTIEKIHRTETQAFLTLDDGRVVTFTGWGYDEWGLYVDLEGEAGSPPG